MPAVLSGARDHRFRAEEGGGQDHLVPDEDAVDVHVVSVELPAPGAAVLGIPVEGEPVQPLVQPVRVVAQLTDGEVEAHQVDRLAVPLSAEALLNDGQGSPASRLVELLQADAVAQEVAGAVVPVAPAHVVHREPAVGELFLRQARQVVLRRPVHRTDVRARVTQREQSRLYAVRRGHSPEGLVRSLHPPGDLFEQVGCPDLRFARRRVAPLTQPHGLSHRCSSSRCSSAGAPPGGAPCGRVPQASRKAVLSAMAPTSTGFPMRSCSRA